MLQKTEDPRQAYIIDKIKELNLRFPVADIAEKTGISKSQVSKTLQGKIAVSDHFFETFNRVYGLGGDFSPFSADDPQNWERAKLIALQKKLALFMSMFYESQGRHRTYEDCLEDIDNDTTVILGDLRRKRKG